MDKAREKVPGTDELHSMYRDNPDYRKYVDKFRRAGHRTAEEALECLMCAYKAMDIKGDLKVGDTGKL